MKPNSNELKEIYKETYNFYLKYKSIATEREFDNALKESNLIYKRYPFKTCMNQLVDMMELLEYRYVNKIYN